MIRAGSLGLFAMAAVGCASSHGAAGSSPSVTDQAASGQLGPALLQWTGRFRAQVQHDPHIIAPNRNEASGSVELTAPAESRTAVKLDVRLPQFTDPVRLYWSIASGPCGSNALPLLPVSQFPQISITSSVGSVDATLPFAMPTTGEYHVNVFAENSDGRDESGVISCASLSLQKRRGRD
jgi:hypothetical protein